MQRLHYKPRFSWRPIVPVRWRSGSRAYGDAVRLSWRLYLFGVLPIASLPRKSS